MYLRRRRSCYAQDEGSDQGMASQGEGGSLLRNNIFYLFRKKGKMFSLKYEYETICSHQKKIKNKSGHLRLIVK